MKKPQVRRLAIVMIVALAIGCEASDDRLVEIARESNRQQAAQNQAVTQLNRHAADNHRRVVEAVEKSRQEIALLERDVDKQRTRLEEERQSIANERFRESMLAPILDHLGMLLVASIPLALCWLLLYGLRQPVSDDEVAELLVHELMTAEQESSVPRLGHEERPRLEASEEAEELPF